MNIFEVNVFDWYKANSINEEIDSHNIDMADIEQSLTVLKYQHFDRDGDVSPTAISNALVKVNDALIEVLLDKRISNDTNTASEGNCALVTFLTDLRDSLKALLPPTSAEPMSSEDLQDEIESHMVQLITSKCGVSKSQARLAYAIVAEELSHGWLSADAAIPPMDLIASDMAVDLVEEEYKASGLKTPDMNVKYRLMD